MRVQVRPCPHVVSPLWIQETLGLSWRADEKDYIVEKPADPIWLHETLNSERMCGIACAALFVSELCSSHPSSEPQAKRRSSGAGRRKSQLLLIRPPEPSSNDVDVHDELFSSSQQIRKAEQPAAAVNGEPGNMQRKRRATALEKVLEQRRRPPSAADRNERAGKAAVTKAPPSEAAAVVVSATLRGQSVGRASSPAFKPLFAQRRERAQASPQVSQRQPGPQAPFGGRWMDPAAADFSFSRGGQASASAAAPTGSKPSRRQTPLRAVPARASGGASVKLISESSWNASHRRPSPAAEGPSPARVPQPPRGGGGGQRPAASDKACASDDGFCFAVARSAPAPSPVRLPSSAGRVLLQAPTSPVAPVLNTQQPEGEEHSAEDAARTFSHSLDLKPDGGTLCHVTALPGDRGGQLRAVGGPAAMASLLRQALSEVGGSSNGRRRSRQGSGSSMASPDGTALLSPMQQLNARAGAIAIPRCRGAPQGSSLSSLAATPLATPVGGDDGAKPAAGVAAVCGGAASSQCFTEASAHPPSSRVPSQAAVASTSTTPAIAIRKRRATTDDPGCNPPGSVIDLTTQGVGIGIIPRAVGSLVGGLTEGGQQRETSAAEPQAKRRKTQNDVEVQAEQQADNDGRPLREVEVSLTNRCTHPSKACEPSELAIDERTHREIATESVHLASTTLPHTQQQRQPCDAEHSKGAGSGGGKRPAKQQPQGVAGKAMRQATLTPFFRGLPPSAAARQKPPAGPSGSGAGQALRPPPAAEMVDLSGPSPSVTPASSQNQGLGTVTAAAAAHWQTARDPPLAPDPRSRYLLSCTSVGPEVLGKVKEAVKALGNARLCAQG